jgi:hypothetical protein
MENLTIKTRKKHLKQEKYPDSYLAQKKTH